MSWPNGVHEQLSGITQYLISAYASKDLGLTILKVYSFATSGSGVITACFCCKNNKNKKKKKEKTN